MHVMASQRETHPMRLDCRGFPPAEADSLHRLLNLLQTHLKQPWEVALGDSGADMVLLNLDVQPAPDIDAAHRIVGCASKPRNVHGAKLHRPFRAYELLAVLSEFGFQGQAVQQSAVAASKPQDEAEALWRYRLRAWPLGFETWPRGWWPVLATITRQYRCTREIAIRTGLDDAEVQRCLDKLENADLLDREVEHRELPRVEPESLGTWKGLASRVGRLLGFAR